MAFGAAREHARRRGLLHRLGDERRRQDLDRLEPVVRGLARAFDPHEVLGNPRRRGRVTQQDELALEDLDRVRDLNFQRIGDVSDVAAVEVAAVQRDLGLFVDQRVVARAVELDLDRRGGLIDQFYDL